MDMADFSLPAFRHKRLAQVLARLAGMAREGPTRPGAIDPGMLSDHLRRDLGFLDGRATPASSARAGGAIRR
jgi:hypothetical protein